MDYAHELRIPIQEQVTITGKGVHHSPSLALTDELWTAIGAWQAIKDDDESRRVGANIQEKINEYNNKS